MKKKFLKEGMGRERERERERGRFWVSCCISNIKLMRSQRRTKKQKTRRHHVVVSVAVRKENKIKAKLLFLDGL